MIEITIWCNIQIGKHYTLMNEACKVYSPHVRDLFGTHPATHTHTALGAFCEKNKHSASPSRSSCTLQGMLLYSQDFVLNGPLGSILYQNPLMVTSNHKPRSLKNCGCDCGSPSPTFWERETGAVHVDQQEALPHYTSCHFLSGGRP